MSGVPAIHEAGDVVEDEETDADDDEYSGSSNAEEDGEDM